MNKPSIAGLLRKYLAGDCTVAEQREVEDWYASYEEHPPLFEDEQSGEALRLLEKTREAIRAEITESAKPVPVETVRAAHLETGRSRVYPLLKAAAVFILLIAGAAFLFFKQAHPKESTKPFASIQSSRQDRMPGSTKAILTLGDGRTIVLDSTANGELALQGNTKITKLGNGGLIYDVSHRQTAGNNSVVSYNMLSTPRAAQYQLVLPDGSKVWLNTASSIRYPTAFAGRERKVEITGEAYFEVAKNPSMPFRVLVVTPPGKEGGAPSAAGTEIEVLGTHFNVNAYTDERTINTTLLEGSVRINKGARQVTIKPGEQAKLNTAGAIEVENANLEETMAWKRGLFQFDQPATLEVVMRQIARWYDVEILYERDISNDRFQGKMYRDENLSRILKILELSGLRFRIEGKKIIVQ